jgi:hypothetical protein
MDNLDPRDAGREEVSTPRKTTEQEPAMTDREVPLASAHTPEAIHAWLDGENVNESQLHAAEKEYAFWRRVEEETGKRRRIQTPTSLPGEIMRAIKKD